MYSFLLTCSLRFVIVINDTFLFFQVESYWHGIRCKTVESTSLSTASTESVSFSCSSSRTSRSSFKVIDISTSSTSRNSVSSKFREHKSDWNNWFSIQLSWNLPRLAFDREMNQMARVVKFSRNFLLLLLHECPRSVHQRILVVCHSALSATGKRLIRWLFFLLEQHYKRCQRPRLLRHSK